MRKYLLFSVLSCIGLLNVKAQIVITAADVPSPDKMLIRAKDTLTALNVGNADTAQVWNFTAVTEHTRDTSIVMTYADMPNSLFSSANLVVRQGNNEFYGYVLKTSSSLTLVGGSGIVDIQGSPTPINQTSDPAEILFNFPTAYNSSFSNNFRTDAKFYFGQVVSGLTIDSIHRMSGIEKTSVADAWGTLTTPLGGPYNVIRIKEVRTSHDTVMAYFFGDWNSIPGGITTSQTITYYWWANGIGTNLASATVDSSDNVLSFDWLTEYPGTPPVAASAVASDITCEGLCDGTATVIPKWGTAPYTYSWSTSPAQTDTTATGLCAGTYTVIVTDSLLVTTTAIVTVGIPAAPSITVSGSTLTASTGSGYQWLLNDTVISGATNMTYTVTQNGSYTVVVTNNSCTDTSAAYNYTAIGIDEAVAHAAVAVYPNPAGNLVTIAFDAAAVMQPVSIEIRNELGQCVKKTEINTSDKIIVDISALGQGIYFVYVKNNSTVINKKFVKQ